MKEYIYRVRTYMVLSAILTGFTFKSFLAGFSVLLILETLALIAEYACNKIVNLLKDETKDKQL